MYSPVSVFTTIFAGITTLAACQGIQEGTLLPSTNASIDDCTTSMFYNFTYSSHTEFMDPSFEPSTSCDVYPDRIMTLADGVLKDSAGRVCGIVANHQFQCDGPPSQSGTLINGGFALCDRGNLTVLSVGNSSDFYECIRSVDNETGEVVAFYDGELDPMPQCRPVELKVDICDEETCVGDGCEDIKACAAANCGMDTICACLEGDCRCM